MFTGIIEETGQIERIARGAKSTQLRIMAHVTLEDTRIGDSICTSGVCLTVTGLGQRWFEADVMPETLRRSKLSDLAVGSRVNLERAMLLNGRLGGHMVSGHIDGTGMIRAVSREDNAVWLTVSAEAALLRYIVEKGSVAIDGVSLTVAAVERSGFRVSVIPHTGRETTLLQQKIGDAVNLECDIIGKYVEKLLVAGQPGPKQAEDENKDPLSETFLRNNGFY